MTVRQARGGNGHEDTAAEEVRRLTQGPPPEGRKFSLRGLLVPVAVIVAGIVLLRRLQDDGEA